MQTSFAQIIEQLNSRLPRSDNFAFAMARAAVIPGDYMLNTILPQENRPDFHVDGGSMSITPTMLGQVPMDSPFPPMGAMSSTQFFENTTKLGGHIFFPEKAQREILAWENSLISVGIRNGGTIDAVNGQVNANRMNAVLGFGRMIIKSHWDTYEWLRGQALTTGKLDWTFGKIPLKVDYNIPAGNIRTFRTGGDSYAGATTKFWEDMRWINTKFAEGFEIVMNSNTWLAIIGNPYNNIRVVVNQGDVREIIRFVGTTETNSTDVRDRVRISIYNKSGSVINAKTGELQVKAFVPDGKIFVVGRATPDGFELTTGSVENPNNDLRLGYTHIAPTIEGMGQPGIWSRVFVPEGKPMQLLGETAVNMLPAILNPTRLLLLSTALT
jgi:hypothetical protein